MINRRNNISQIDRERIIQKSLEGISAKEIANILNLNYKTVWLIISKFNKTGIIKNKIRGGDKRSKLSENIKNEIISWVNADCLLRLSDIVEKVWNTYQIRVSKSLIDRLLKKFHFNLKNIIRIPERRNTIQTIELRFNYATRFRNIESSYQDKNFIFLDEVGFQVVSRAKKGRSKIGTSPCVTVSAAKSRNISVFAAMNKYGMLYHKIHNNAINGEDFKQCMISLTSECLLMGISNPIFILDNARIHHYHGLDRMLSDLNINFFFLPPYSPFLNPIENIFSKWKNLVVRSQVRNENELKEIISLKFEDIQESDCDSFYRKMLKYIQKAERKEIINE